MKKQSLKKELSLSDISKQLVVIADGLHKKIDKLEEKVDRKIDALAATSSQALDRIEDSQLNTQYQLEGMNKRLDQVDSEVHGLRLTINRLEMSYERKIPLLEEDMSAFRTSLIKIKHDSKK